MVEIANSIAFIEIIYLIICLFVCGLTFNSRILEKISSCRGHIEVSITAQGLQIFNWHSWPLSTEGSLSCHAYCDTGHSFPMVISEDP